MLVYVKLYATLTRHRPNTKGGEPFEVELPEGSTLGDLYRHLGVPQEEVKTAFVNGRAEGPRYTIQAGDEIGIFPPIGGG